jgi:HSP20 family protein
MNTNQGLAVLRDAWNPFFDHAAPAYEVSEEEQHFTLALETPGTKKEDIKIELVNELLTISGERKGARFSRSFSLPPGIDAQKVQAGYQDGVLRVSLPKSESSKPRQIPIAS